MFRNQNGEKRSMWNCGTNFPSLPTRVVLGHTSLFFLGFFFRLRCTAMCNLVGTQTASQQTLRDSPTWVSTFIIQSRDRTVSKILFRRYLDFCWQVCYLCFIIHPISPLKLNTSSKRPSQTLKQHDLRQDLFRGLPSVSSSCGVLGSVVSGSAGGSTDGHLQSWARKPQVWGKDMRLSVYLMLQYVIV